MITREQVINLQPHNFRKLARTHTVKELCQLCGIGESAIYERKKELKLKSQMKKLKKPLALS